jgi:hypothetical protein
MDWVWRNIYNIKEAFTMMGRILTGLLALLWGWSPLATIGLVLVTGFVTWLGVAAVAGAIPAFIHRMEEARRVVGL